MAAPPFKAPIAGSLLVTPEWLGYFTELSGSSVQVIRSGVAVTLSTPSTGLVTSTSTDAADLTGGPIPAGVMPALSGDVTMPEGILTTTLVNIPAGVQETITRLGTLTTPLRLASDVDCHLVPALTDTYDLGSVTRWWRQGYLSQLNAVLFALETQTLFGGYATIGHDAGTFAADVTSAATTIDFGKTMTPNDFVLVRSLDTAGAAVTEYLQVGTLVSGTTYNVTRNLSGAGAKNWAAGVAFLVLGTSGDGRIDLFAYDGKPRIMFHEQGATYNAQNLRGQLGNLNGSFGYATDIFGAAFGDYSTAWLAVDATNGLRMGEGTDIRLQLSTSGSFVLNTPDITLGTSGAYSSAGALKFERQAGYGGTGDIFGLYSVGAGATQQLKLENTANRDGVDNATAQVFLVATGWNLAGDAFSTPATVRVQSDAGTASILLDADFVSITGEVYERERGDPMGGSFTRDFAAGNYTADTGASDWALASGDVLTEEYELTGDRLTFQFYYQTTTTTNTPLYLKVALPPGYTATKTTDVTILVFHGGAWARGHAYIAAGESFVRFYRDTAGGLPQFSGTTWPNETNAIWVLGQMTIFIG